jgi:hypothetical protein
MKFTLSNEKIFIDELKKISKKSLTILEETRPTNGQVKKIVADLLNGKSIDYTINKLVLPKSIDKKEFIINILAKFGTWITHSVDLNKQNIKKYNNKFNIPKGYEPESNNGRDITRAITAIYNNNPSDEMITRFVDRTYRLRNSNITINSLNSVVAFSNNKRFFELTKVSSDPIYYKNIVESFNLLYNNYVSAKKIVISLEAHSSDVIKNYNKIYKDLMKIIWLCESSILRFLSFKDKNSKNTVLETEYRFLIKKLNLELSKITVIGALNSGQIKRIAALNNIIVDQPSRENETKIRTTLKVLGLGSDADKLVPDALRADDLDKLDEFWSIIQSRIDGDITWSEQLEELLN